MSDGETEAARCRTWTEHGPAPLGAGARNRATNTLQEQRSIMAGESPPKPGLFAQDEPLSPQARAVLEKAEEVWSQAFRAPGDADFMDCYIIHRRFFKELGDAIRAYHTTLQPVGVRPEEVEPGTRFRFVYGALGVWRKVAGPHGASFALCEEYWILLTLKDDDLIIPTKDQ